MTVEKDSNCFFSMYIRCCPWTLLGFSLTITECKPLDLRNTKTTFTVTQSLRKPEVKSGPVALAAMYSKYNRQIPGEVKVAAAHDDSSTVRAAPEQYDSEYLSSVSIGGQTVNLDIDTGSSDL